MGGGELQLALAGGQMSEYLTGSSSVAPKMTFFKSVYQKYHNFAQESISLPFDRNINWVNSESVVTCEMKRYGQLLHKMCVTMTLPSLKFTTTGNDEDEINKRYIYQAKWVPYIGTALIKTAELFIGGVLIQTLTGEWIHTYYHTHSDSNERRAYQSLIGHIDDLVGTREPNIEHAFTNPGRTIHIPLPFLCDETVSAIPLVALQFAKVEVRVTFRALNEVLLIRRREVVAPRCTNISISGAEVTNNPTPQFIVEGDSGAVPKLTSTPTTGIGDENEIPLTFIDNSGTYICSISGAPLSDGEYTITAVLEHTVTGTSQEQQCHIYIHTTPPEEPSISGVHITNIKNPTFDVIANTNESEPSVSGVYVATDLTIQSVNVYVQNEDGENIDVITETTFSRDADNNYIFSITTPELEDGEYTLYATCTDNLGNVSASGATFNLTIDITPPMVEYYVRYEKNNVSQYLIGFSEDISLSVSGSGDLQFTELSNYDSLISVSGSLSGATLIYPLEMVHDSINNPNVNISGTNELMWRRNPVELTPPTQSSNVTDSFGTIQNILFNGSLKISENENINETLAVIGHIRFENNTEIQFNISDSILYIFEIQDPQYLGFTSISSD